MYLRDPDGEIKGYSGRDHINFSDCWTPVLPRGKSHTVSKFGTKLCRSADGKKLWLEGYDYTDSFFYIGPLKPGRYYFWFVCTSNPTPLCPAKEEDGCPVWDSTTWTHFVAIEIIGSTLAKATRATRNH
jgi:hypothetical protein